jgi:hypothetical protein
MKNIHPIPVDTIVMEIYARTTSRRRRETRTTKKWTQHPDPLLPLWGVFRKEKKKSSLMNQ